ncbi:hypothetical protein COO60DRAFT_1671551 [Scenedesmus sp. NREL 46B-D3]|nr:hypothetical protein COO60DRAFT_1671551 [Scenedesmus sp. NREL 46B-D3]
MLHNLLISNSAWTGSSIIAQQNFQVHDTVTHEHSNPSFAGHPSAAGSPSAAGAVASSSGDATDPFAFLPALASNPDPDLTAGLIRSLIGGAAQQSVPLGAAAAQQQAAAILSGFGGSSSSGSMQHVTNANLEQMFPGATGAAPSLLATGAVPTAGVSGAALPGGWRDSGVPVFSLAHQPVRGLLGRVRGPCTWLESLAPGNKANLRVDTATHEKEFSASFHPTLVSEAKLPELIPTSVRYEELAYQWYLLRTQQPSSSSSNSTAYILPEEEPAYLRFWRQLADCYHYLQAAGLMDWALLAFLRLDCDLRSHQHTHGCAWDALPVTELFLQALVQPRVEVVAETITAAAVAAAVAAMQQQQPPRRQQQQQQRPLGPCRHYNSEASCALALL